MNDQQSPKKATYVRPQVTSRGALESVTLGGSVGVGDSGVQNTRPPGTPPNT